ncbi:MAG: FixH family protein [Terracoccus sp.]
MDHEAIDHAVAGDGETGSATGSGERVLTLTTGAGAAAGTLTARVADVRGGGGSIELTLAGVDGQPLVPVAAPTLALSLTRGTSRIRPISLPLEQAGPGTYRAAVDFPLGGTWTVQVGVRTSTYDNPVVTFPVAVP